MVTALAFVQSGCGYHVAGRTDALPPSIHVIAVPALENATTSYRIEQKLTAATVHEFLAKTPYKVVSNPLDGDAVLRGKVVGLEAVPLLFDTVSGRATTMLGYGEVRSDLDAGFHGKGAVSRRQLYFSQ